MSETIYCGSGKEHTFHDGGSIITVDLTLDGLKDLFQKYGYTDRSGKKHIKLKVQQRRQIGKYGETHSVSIDTFKPDPNRTNIQSNQQTGSQPFEEDIPF